MRAGRLEPAGPILRWVRAPGPIWSASGSTAPSSCSGSSETETIFLSFRRKPNLRAAVGHRVEDFSQRIMNCPPLQFGLDVGLRHDENINHASGAERRSMF